MCGMNLSQTSLQNKNITSQGRANNAVVEEKYIIQEQKQSKGPDRVANSMGVVTGTCGMIGGGILGGTIGIFKLPAETAKVFVNHDYETAIKNAFGAFGESFKSNQSIKQLKFGFSKLFEELNNTKSPEAAEELLNIAKTLASKLNETFAHDATAKGVVNKVLDPLISSVPLRKNMHLIGSGIGKLLGIPIKTTTVVTNVTSKVVKGIGTTIANIQSFTPEEKEAWGKVAKQISKELSTNPNIQKSKKVLTHTRLIFRKLKNLTKDSKWFGEPLKELQGTLVKEIKKIDLKLSLAPVKTMGIYAVLGSVACGTISILGWLGLKKILLPKSKEK